ncbi:MAG: hypothetical protein HY927_04100 [Elusimicrobia bacterium]|nr:hypothetical protein [Elusimicrobiota bacterium]
MTRAPRLARRGPLAVLLLALGPPLLAQTTSSSTFRLALVEPSPHLVSTTLDVALERILRAQGGDAELLDADTETSEVLGKDHRFPFPAGPGQAILIAGRLDSPGESAFVLPPVPSLIEQLMKAARDPATYRSPWSVSFSSSRVILAAMRDSAGESVASTSFAEGLPWGKTVATAYRLNWRGSEVRIIHVAKAYGGLGRLASALESEALRGPFIGVARGEVFGDADSKTKGAALAEALERMGLKVSAVGCAEIKRYAELDAYRQRRPDGIRFLSANLVYSSAPAQTFFDDHMIVEAGGIRVLLTAVTPDSCRKYMALGGLKHLSLTDAAAALQAKVPAWRGEDPSAVDAVVLLARAGEFGSLEAKARGVDLVLAEDHGSPDYSLEPAETRAEQRGRRPLDTPLLVMRTYTASLGLLELGWERDSQAIRWKAGERHLRLDERFPEAPGSAAIDRESYGLEPSTSPVLIPSVWKIFSARPGNVRPRISAEGFWSLSAGLLAEATRSEAALLRVRPLGIAVEGDVKEGLARFWLHGDPAVIVRLKGSQLRPLIARALKQQQRASQGLPPGGDSRFVAGGVGPDGAVHGMPIADEEEYRVATSRVLFDALGLSPEREPEPAGGTVEDIVVAALKEREKTAAPRYREWMEGRPVKTRGLWRLNFRDIGLNVQSTRVVRDDAFSSVPNSRIQGYDELLLGWIVKADAEYLRSLYKWRNTVEMEYARSAVTRRNQETVINITANNLRLLTLGTRRAGGIGSEWLARSWGPSLGVQFDGQIEAVPGLKRKEIYSVFPGVEFYDGSWVRSLEISGSFKRDVSRDPPDTQYGLRSRLTMAHDIGSARRRPITLQGEAHASYFFLTGHDKPQDLRMEAGLRAKLRIPVYRHLSIAPFLDLYWFSLKVQPLWGYSAMTGVTIGFSRLWKPQYEGF